MLAWVKKRRRTIRREDLISFLCGKAPPHRSSRANPRLTMMAPSRANSPAETGSSVEADLQPFREAIALHGENTLTQAVSKIMAYWWLVAWNKSIRFLGCETLAAAWCRRTNKWNVFYIFSSVSSSLDNHHCFILNELKCDGAGVM